jgi:ketosteroid isomerase-like protein
VAFSELDVLEANNAFYDAFARRDGDAMARVWSASSPLVCVHPGWRPVFGRRAVIDSWKRIFAATETPVDVRTTHASVHRVSGAALVVCFELIGERALVASNTFVEENGGWRLVHHHSTPVSKAPDLQVDPDKVH